jgi:hypothetical protein
MRSIDMLLKFAIMFALVTVVPFWLMFHTEWGVLISIGVPFVAAFLLSTVWMGGRA